SQRLRLDHNPLHLCAQRVDQETLLVLAERLLTFRPLVGIRKRIGRPDRLHICLWPERELMAGPQQSFGIGEAALLPNICEGLVSQVLEELFDAVGVEIGHGQPLTASGLKYRQEERKVTKAIAPVTHNRAQAKRLSFGFDALGNQLFESALTGSRDVVKPLTVKRPEVGVSRVSRVFGKGNNG